MTTLNLDTITDQVRNFLQREIEAGRLTPGTRLREAAFAKDLGISKSPLRFALYQLKQDGLVRIEPRRGFYVALPTAREMTELLEMREVLEGLAARKAASRATEEIVRRLSDCFRAFDDSNINNLRLEYAAADHRFHTRLVEASGSDELIRTLRIINLRLHMNRIRARLSQTRHDMVPVHHQHLAIIAAIAARNPDEAELLTSAHVASVPWEAVLGTDGRERSEAVNENLVTR